MKYFNIFILALFCSTVNNAQECSAKISLSSDNHNAVYFVDGEKLGEGKIISVEKNRGVYMLRINDGKNLWDPVVIYDTLLINECKDYYFNYFFPRRTLLLSDPVDAYVYSNDTLLGSTPLNIIAAPKMIQLKKPGYKDLVTDLENVSASLKLEKTMVKNSKSFYKGDLFKYLIGGLVILGGTTAYFKLMADDKFESYQFTGDDKLLKETRRYDLISGITFGALQINFGILLYYFLSE